MAGEGKNDTGGEKYNKITFDAYSIVFFFLFFFFFSVVENVQMVFHYMIQYLMPVHFKTNCFQLFLATLYFD